MCAHHITLYTVFIEWVGYLNEIMWPDFTFFCVAQSVDNTFQLLEEAHFQGHGSLCPTVVAPV